MKLFIETALKDLIILLLDDDFNVVSKSITKDLIKKADALPSEVIKVLDQGNKNIKDIKEFYITFGPGSFMGARTALVYTRTICQLTNSKLYTISTIDLLSKGSGDAFVDAKGNKSYTKVNNELTLVDFQESSILDIDDLVNNFKNYSSLFKEEKSLIDIKPYYVKDPQIGGE